MKVIHVVSKFAGGGLERRAIQVVKGLCAQTNLEQRIIVYSSLIEYQEVHTLGLNIYFLKNNSKISRCLELIEIIKEYRPDIVHSWLDRFPTDQVLLSLSKYIFRYKYIHGAVCDANPISKLSSVWIGQKISFMCADVIISNSKAGLVAKDAPTKKSVIIYNGFDFARIPEIIHSEKKKELGINAGLMVTMCGRIDVSKDWESYIEVARISKENGLDAFFVAVGNGVLIDEYARKLKARGIDNIVFTGRRSDVEEIIALSDVCMLLSNPERHLEGVSNFIMESMASEKTVIATNGGGTPEIITDGETGYVVNDNINEAFSRLKELLEDEEKRSRMGKKAKEEIIHRFTLSQMTERYAQLYHRLISK